ncbi:SET domain-containing protein SmydA-8-like [Oratosquilla oratoria]|uniref:SET domain-containing protein SmydA-8-like n=1 Tax=Oratosquilla oratoria TaxID=337810 RepID=UPI003F76622F
MMAGGVCALCMGPASQRCGKCHVVCYCSREHQKQHWKTHKNECSPYRVLVSEVLGRYLEASRDIEPGEVILKDTPLLLGPKQVTVPVCLGCFTPVDGSYTCTDCGWPMCSAECQSITLHTPECQMSTSYRGTKVQVTKFLQVNQMYECISPLRCLWLKDKAPDKWKMLMAMESHLEERKNTEVYLFNQTNVVEFIKNYLKVPDFSEQEVQEVCGIIDVNGFEIPGPNMIGLYGKACMLEHTCIPNTSRTFDSQMNIVVRAAVPIRKGQHITTSYTDPMWGTANRQIHLKNSKYFECSCQRCRDPTEMGTHLSSLRCELCKDGLLQLQGLGKENAEEPQKLWVCSSCKTSKPTGEVDDLLKEIGERLVNLRGSLKASEVFLKDTAKVLSENHYYRTDVKLALAQMYGHAGTELKDVDPDILDRKEKLCKEVLALADIFCPGLIRLRGLLQYELQACLLERHRRLPKKQKTSDKAKTLLQDASQALKDSSKILVLESPLQDEYQLGLDADSTLQHVTQMLMKFKH